MPEPTHESFAWEEITTSRVRTIYRARVTNGFLVMDCHGGVTYVPDSRHHWTPLIKNRQKGSRHGM